jgi:hypothetical protein
MMTIVPATAGAMHDDSALDDVMTAVRARPIPIGRARAAGDLRLRREVR